MTATGGMNGLGVVFKLIPMQNGAWNLKVIHAFTGGTDGAGGSSGRLLRYRGSLYGVTTVAGVNGKVVVFKLTHLPGIWQFTTLYAFKGQPDAGFPYGALAPDSQGHLYGTTYYDGANNLGSVYQLARQPDGTWQERVLYSFKGGRDGSGWGVSQFHALGRCRGAAPHLSMARVVLRGERGGHFSCLSRNGVLRCH